MISATFAYAFGVGAAVLALAGWAQAQSQTPATPVAIAEKVEVVATRLPESPDEVPAAIEVLTGDDLRNLGATTLKDALALAAGVEVAPGGDTGPAGSVPEFWGLRELDAFLLVVDDIPWGGAFNPALTSLSLRDVERVEILRGAAPVTFGATSFVGVIHVVHKAAAAQTSYATGQFGSYGSGGGGIDVALPSSARWRSRLSADVDRQGFRDERTSYARGHALYRGAIAGASSRTWVMTDLSWLSQNPASPHPREGAGLSSNVPLDANYNQANAFLDETRLTAAFGTERPVFQAASLGIAASYTHSAQSQFRGFLTDIANTAGNATGLRENIDINDIYADAHITWPERSHVRVIGGGDLLFGNGEGRGATFAYTVPLDAGSATNVTEPVNLTLDAESRRMFVGGYLLAEIVPAPKVRISTGLRVNATVERRGEGESVTHARPSGSVGAIVSVWQQGANHVRVFADYRNTFKPAAFDFSLAENEGVLEPETARSVESGVKLRTAAGRLDVEASGFRMSFTNLVTATVVNGLPALINSGRYHQAQHHQDRSGRRRTRAAKPVGTRGLQLSRRHIRRLRPGVRRRPHATRRQTVRDVRTAPVFSRRDPRAPRRRDRRSHRQAHGRPLSQQAKHGAGEALRHGRHRDRVPVQTVRSAAGWPQSRRPAGPGLGKRAWGRAVLSALSADTQIECGRAVLRPWI